MIMYTWAAIFSAIVVRLSTGDMITLEIRDLDNLRGYSTRWQCVRHVRYAVPRLRAMMETQAFPPPMYLVTLTGKCEEVR